MYDLTITKVNEAFIRVQCERSVAQELSDYFTFQVPGYQFVPEYKNKLWDGKIRLFNLKTNQIYYGLIPYIKKFSIGRNYQVYFDKNVEIEENFSLKEADDFISTINVPFPPKEYQKYAFVHAIRNKRILLLSPTASGKSFIQYLIVRYIQQQCKKGLLIVPTTSLVEQMYSDFKSYGYDSEQYCHRQYSGKEKYTDKFLTITTWQSIYNLDSSYFEQFDFVLGDEAHQFKAKSLTTIMSGLSKTKYRIGCTGTLDGTKTHKLVLEGLFGPVLKVTTTKELIDDKVLSDFRIKCLILKYADDICRESKKWDYQKEIEYIVMNTQRNIFIKNLTLSLNGNSLILFQFVAKQGKILYNMINTESNGRKVFFIFGDTEVETRESIRSITENESNAIIIASYGTFSTGINIRNLHNVIFASPSKSRIRNLQSIGRGLRRSDNKEVATLFDIADDLRIGKHTNFTLNHFVERVKIYDEEKFNYKFYNIELKNG